MQRAENEAALASNVSAPAAHADGHRFAARQWSDGEGKDGESRPGVTVGLRYVPTAGPMQLVEGSGHVLLAMVRIPPDRVQPSGLCFRRWVSAWEERAAPATVWAVLALAHHREAWG